MKNYNKLTSLAAAAFVLAGTSLSAATVLVDVSASNIITNPEDALYWNSIGTGTNTTATITGLVDSTNTATSFNFSITPNSVNASGVSGAGFGGTGVNGPDGASEPFIGTAATSDGLFSNNDANGTTLFSFTGLAASSLYDFSAIGGRASGGVDGQIIILDSPTLIGSGNASGNTSYQLLNDGTIANFSVASTTAGEIWFEFRGQTGNSPDNATFNAFSIDGPVPVPEPSAFALLAGMFGLTWVMLRRRA